MIGCIYFFLASIKLCLCPILFWCTLHIFCWYDRTHFTTETFLSISYQIDQNEVQIQTPNDLSMTNNANCQRCFRLSTLCLTCPPTYVILEKKKKRGFIDFLLQRTLSCVYDQYHLTCLSVILSLWLIRALRGRSLWVLPLLLSPLLV